MKNSKQSLEFTFAHIQTTPLYERLQKILGQPISIQATALTGTSILKWKRGAGELIITIMREPENGYCQGGVTFLNYDSGIRKGDSGPDLNAILAYAKQFVNNDGATIEFGPDQTEIPAKEQRLNNLFFDAMCEERRRQLSKWGADDPETTDETFFRILIEEVVEVEKAIKSGDIKNLSDEIVQVATVTMAWLACKGFLTFVNEGENK